MEIKCDNCGKRGLRSPKMVEGATGYTMVLCAQCWVIQGRKEQVPVGREKWAPGYFDGFKYKVSA